MKALQDLEIFVRTVDTGSLSATARGLDLTPAAASAALKRLEEELQAPLFVRSTRSLRLTREGEVFLAHCRPALAALRDAQLELSSGRQQVRGMLQLAAPSDFGRNLLLPWLEAFQQLHPGIQYRLHLSDRVTNVYSDLVDAAFRQGDPPDSSMLALPVDLTNRRVLCASPAYLAKHGAPDTPLALAQHACLCFMLGEDVYDRWRFWRDGEEAALRVGGGNIANDGDVVRLWALAGRGVIYKSGLDVAADLAAGRLVALCTEWQTEASPIYMVLPGRRQLTPGLRLLREFIAERCAALSRA
ncbi:DNA-binding transcriptional regulator, LysR family [Polaromonas sp. YR568]|uniref:LysR family transcriptional regulator n=1 Tax=Polaromonas sp. YR568 TaxID=1855301 RepID=UPI0008ED35C3|nr:LysR family transcriptional regulator [Polaromonas sp. YR568]SFU94900.1 DNA-binding transcriptional regulator, LysR family [Polaromonas sp. YR568]